MSLYSFAMVTEFFTIQMEELHEKGVIKNIYGVNDDINHMIYADDLIIIMRADLNSVKALKHAFECMDKFATQYWQIKKFLQQKLQ